MLHFNFPVLMFAFYVILFVIHTHYIYKYGEEYILYDLNNCVLYYCMHVRIAY